MTAHLHLRHPRARRLLCHGRCCAPWTSVCAAPRCQAPLHAVAAAICAGWCVGWLRARTWRRPRAPQACALRRWRQAAAADLAAPFLACCCSCGRCACGCRSQQASSTTLCRQCIVIRSLRAETPAPAGQDQCHHSVAKTCVSPVNAITQILRVSKALQLTLCICFICLYSTRHHSAVQCAAWVADNARPVTTTGSSSPF